MEVGLAVGSFILSPAVQLLYNHFSPKFLSLFKGHKGADELLGKLKNTLLGIHKVLSDAEDKQVTNIYVKEWLCELRKTVDEAEYLLDEISFEALRMQVEGGDQRVTNRVSHLPTKFLNEIIPKLKVVVDTLKDFESQINTLGLKDIKTESSVGSRVACFVRESDIFGRDDEKERLIHMVLSEHDDGNDIIVIPIVGMGGLGKTTLAQFVYRDEMVQKEFEEKAWVSLSENIDLLEITKTLVKQITHSAPQDENDLYNLQAKLNDSLKNKKFFIVLDNVWIENYISLESLSAPLNCGRKGSVILVTTRNEGVADKMRTEKIFRIDRLSDTDSWSLFIKHAFIPHAASSKFEEIGKKIVEKCKGLPLAIKMVAGILRFKIEVKDWDDVFRSELLTLEKKPNDLLSVLELSYRHLPPELKCCFAFCAIFPKNYPFDEEELVLLWMANDLLDQSGQDVEPLKDRGHKNFSELRSRSFFQKNDDNKYLMHDLINDLARYICGKDCVRFEDCQRILISSETRYFSYVPRNGDATGEYNWLAQLKGLRTFYYHHYYRGQKLLHFSNEPTGLERLRALTYCDYRLKELPHFFCSLKHLRLLNLSRTSISKLPDAICSMYNLQSLLLSECSNLHELPMKLTKLVNLHHLDLKGTELRRMPSHMSRLKNLQTLSYFIVGNSSGESIMELGNLHLCGYLKIMGLENVISVNDALKANLSKKNQLEELVLQWNGNADDSQIASDILEKLQPNATLKSLTIDGYDGERFPNWLSVDSLSDLSSLCFTNCKNCFVLPRLRHIETFLKVERIVVEDCPLLESLPHVGPLANLRELTIGVCPSLVLLPCLGPSANIRKLTIRNCAKLVFPKGEGSEGYYNSLEHLWVENVGDSFGEISFGSFPKLLSLYIKQCGSMKVFSAPHIVIFPKVERIVVEDCPLLVSLPHVGPLANLRELTIRVCPSLELLPCLGPSANIRKLTIRNCTKLEFPKGEGSEGYYNSLEHLWVENVGDSFGEISFGSFPKLLSLYINQCESLKVFSAPPRTQNLSFLRQLRISDCDNLLSFPEGGLPAPNLEYFNVLNCKKLKSLPEQMRSLLPRLRSMWMSYCPEIECFPTEGLPTSVAELYVNGCPLLTPHLERERGKYWSIIAHIPKIVLDGKCLNEVPQSSNLECCPYHRHYD